MAPCLNCGKETTNLFEYFSGHQTRRSTTSQGTTTTTTTHFENVQQHMGALCSRCAFFRMAVWFAAFAVFWLLAVAGIIVSRLTGNPTATVGIIIVFAAVALGCALGATNFFLKVKNRRVPSYNFVIYRVIDLASRNFPKDVSLFDRDAAGTHTVTAPRVVHGKM